MKTSNTRIYKGIPLDIRTELNSYIVLDTETTGLSPVNNRIIEVAAVRVDHGEITGQFQTLVKPPLNAYGQLVPYQITRITGIDAGMLKDAPSFEEIADHLIEFISDLAVIGHNVNFDINFLYESFERCNGYHFSNNFVDTLSASRKLLPGISHSLGDLAQYFNVVNNQAHRAMSDTLTTYRCYLKLREMALQNGAVTAATPYRARSSGWFF